MKIVYLILAHRYPGQLLRLVDRLDYPEARFLVHLDAGGDSGLEEVVSALRTKSNVRFLKRHECAWGGFGIVQATYEGIKEVVENDLDFDYLVLLSGQDYPIQPGEQILRFFSKRAGTSFIHCNSFPYSVWHGCSGGWERVETWNFVTKERIIRIPNKRTFDSFPGLRVLWRAAASLVPPRKFPMGMHPHGGAQFWCLSRKHVHYLHDFIEKNPSLYAFFRYVMVPDEIFFQTIMANSPFAEEIHSDTLTFLEWDRPGAVLVSSDFDAIVRSGHLFARKFDATIDSRILDRIDREILNVDGTTAPRRRGVKKEQRDGENGCSPRTVGQRFLLPQSSRSQ